MSQAKVDRYKEEKANRKKVMRKEKIANRLRKCAVAVVAAAVVVAAVAAAVAVQCGEGWCESASERVRGDPSQSLGCC